MGTGKKRGRPFSGEFPLSVDTKIKVDEKTHEKLIQYSNENGIAVAETIRRAIKLFFDKAV